MEKCSECNGRMIRKEVDFKIYGVSIGKFPAWICPKCKEELFDEETSRRIEKVAKEKGLWGLGKKTKITRTGNSLAIRIPKEIVNYLNLKDGEEAFIYPDGKRIVIEEISHS